MDKVILVNENDDEVGSMDKLEAHYKGLLHRAFSIFIFNTKGEMLIQKRAKVKYHSGGLWTNTCCSHPLPGESIELATRRRLKHEMGIDIQPSFIYKFIYKAPLDRDLIEHELDHVFVGTFDGVPKTNADEVEDWKFVSMAELKDDIKKRPQAYTHWFKLILNTSRLEQFV